MAHTDLLHQAKWPSLIWLILGTALLSIYTQRTPAFQAPDTTAIIVLFFCGATVISISRFIPKQDVHAHEDARYESVPLTDLTRSSSPDTTLTSGRGKGYPTSLRSLRLSFIGTIIAICSRVLVFKAFVENVQCAHRTQWSTLIPIAFALQNYWSVQRLKRQEVYDDVDESIYDAAFRSISHSPFPHLVATTALGIGGWIALASTGSPLSSYICAASSVYHWLIPKFQIAAAILDVMIIFGLVHLLTASQGRGQRSLRLRVSSVGWAFVFPPVLLMMIGVFHVYTSAPVNTWFPSVSQAYTSSVLTLSSVASLTFISALVLVFHAGVMTTSVIVMFTSFTTIATVSSWNMYHPYPPLPLGSAFAGILLATTAFAIYVGLETASERNSSTRPQHLFTKIPAFLYLALVALLVFWTVLWGTHTTSVSFHPIDLLIYRSQHLNEATMDQASNGSIYLRDLVTEYTRRYSRPPPPNFDVWFGYAHSRQSVYIDNFDSLHNNLQPFWALSPQDIRQRTLDLIADSANDIVGISIRGGAVERHSVSPNTPESLLKGLRGLINNYAQWIPDMDLALSPEDQSHVVVAYKELERMRSARNVANAPNGVYEKAFSNDRVFQWIFSQEEGQSRTPLEDISPHVMPGLLSVGCSSDSAARSQYFWDKSSACIECTYAHSLGGFISDWERSRDVCHQPDTEDLLHLSSSSGRLQVTHKLYPIFSTSKFYGTNNILYPSAEGWLEEFTGHSPDEIYRDSLFGEKDASLFWRGSIFQGNTLGRTDWQGMMPQRFLHLTNPNRDSSSRLFAASELVLLPGPHGDGKLAYTSLPTTLLSSLFPSDIRYISPESSCTTDTCKQQVQELPATQPEPPFQSHWRHKFLLDLDGPGSSDKFIPFLRSNSLPLKSTFASSWYSDRLTPWHHFIPLDPRGHSLYSTLAYFTGIEEINEGDTSLTTRIQRSITATLRYTMNVLERSGGRVAVPNWPQHEIQAERIATQGRDWADRVLRREDMEIYMFRLLLEWGRLTDDRRDVLGFVL